MQGFGMPNTMQGELQELRAAAQAGHEIADHMWEHRVPREPDLALLLDAGYAYMGNGLTDDIPYYWVTDVRTPRAM